MSVACVGSWGKKWPAPQQLDTVTEGFCCTHCEVPVDVGHLGVETESEDEKQDSRHHEGTAADELKEVDCSARGTQHDCLYAD